MGYEDIEGSGEYNIFTPALFPLTQYWIQLSNDPTLSSLPLLSTFLKTFARPYLGLVPPASTKQIPSSSEPGTLSSAATTEANGTAGGGFPPIGKEEDELVEKDIRDRFKKMCEGYFENVSKKLVQEHNVRAICGTYAGSSSGLFSACKSKTGGIMRHIFDPARSLRIDSKHMRR